MVDDNKHSERIPVYLTEREFLDCCRQAAVTDKKPAEYIRYALRLAMYGSVGMTRRDSYEFCSADSAPDKA